jgi:hypothetical protein
MAVLRPAVAKLVAELGAGEPGTAKTLDDVRRTWLS